MRKSDVAVWRIIKEGGLVLDEAGGVWRTFRRRVRGSSYQGMLMERVVWMVANGKPIPDGYAVDFVDVAAEDLYHPDNLKLRLTMHERARRREKRLNEHRNSIDDLLLGGAGIDE